MPELPMTRVHGHCACAVNYLGNLVCCAPGCRWSAPNPYKSGMPPVQHIQLNGLSGPQENLNAVDTKSAPDPWGASRAVDVVVAAGVCRSEPPPKAAVAVDGTTGPALFTRERIVWLLDPNRSEISETNNVENTDRK